jgi:ribosomal protein L7/L12
MNRDIIQATVKILKMSTDLQLEVLLKILANNPNAVYTAIGLETQEETVKEKFSNSHRYKVCIANDLNGASKIRLIKLFREVTGAGLYECKGWVEGREYKNLLPGVFARDLTFEAAQTMADDMNTKTHKHYMPANKLLGEQSPTGVVVCVRNEV